MDFYNLLRESIKVLHRNGKVMAFIITLSLLLYSLLYLLLSFFIKSFTDDLLVKLTNPSSRNPYSPDFASSQSGVMEAMRILVGDELAFFIAYSIVSFFISISTIFFSAISYSGKDLSIKDLLLRVARSWIRPFVTLFYIKLLGIGYMTICVMAMLIPFSMVYDNLVASKSIIIVLGIFATTFYLYLSIVWALALVISVIEESCYGIEALGKGGQLVKGNRLDGFILNLLLALLPASIFYFQPTVKDGQRPAIQMLMALLPIFASCLGTVFQFMAYTVLYFKCKKYLGEEIELQDSIQYSKIPTTPLGHEDLP